jgi:nucleoid DNA-binding protein
VNGILETLSAALERGDRVELQVTERFRSSNAPRVPGAIRAATGKHALFFKAGKEVRARLNEKK